MVRANSSKKLSKMLHIKIKTFKFALKFEHDTNQNLINTKSKKTKNLKHICIMCVCRSSHFLQLCIKYLRFKRYIIFIIYFIFTVLSTTLAAINAAVQEQREAYFNGSSYIRLFQPMLLWRHSAISFRTCRGKLI